MRPGLFLLLKKHSSFVIPLLILVVFGALLQVFISKSDLFLLINKHYSEFWDGFFKGYTWLGDGITIVAVAIMLAFVKLRYSVVIILSYAYSAIVAQLLKHSINAPRPLKFFEGEVPIRLIEGYPTHSWNSFPSGHTVSAFAFAVALSYIFPFKKSGLVFFILFLPVAFSRVYLAQHFFQDVYAGLILGAILAFQLIWWLEQSKWFRAEKLEGRLRVSRS